MKNILTLTLAALAITTMGSKTYKTNTIKFSGETYFTFVDNNRYDILQDRFNQMCLVKQKTKVFTNYFYCICYFTFRLVTMPCNRF